MKIETPDFGFMISSLLCNLLRQNTQACNNNMHSNIHVCATPESERERKTSKVSKNRRRREGKTDLHVLR